MTAPLALDAASSASIASSASASAFGDALRAAGIHAELPVDAAILGGFAADRVGYAFAAGYAASLRALIGDALGPVAALCITERGGGHPRAIESTLVRSPADARLRLHGSKRWATFASRADHVLVAAKTGIDEAGRPQLAMMRIAIASPGVTINQMPPPPFMPEIPHAELRFEDVVVDDDALLPGDGYDRYIKPFRTVEDIHVHAALLGYLVRVARTQRWPHSFVEAAASTLAALRGLALEDLTAPALHVALEGTLASGRQLAEAAEGHWAKDDVDGHARWTRDAIGAPRRGQRAGQAARYSVDAARRLIPA